MMYRVIEGFTDLQDNNHAYSVGDIYPRTGAVASDERIAELSSTKNRRGKVLIKSEKPKTRRKTRSEDNGRTEHAVDNAEN